MTGDYNVFIHRLTGRLEKAIKEAKVSNYRLALNAGVSRVTISNIITGKRNLGLETLYKVCGALNLEPANLLKGL